MAAAVDFNPTQKGKFKVLIGDSIKNGAEDSQSANSYSSFRYNTTPPESISKLIQTDNGQFNLSYEDDKDTSYSGTQRPGRKLECVLVYNPKDNTFTLERMSSVFTFNQTHPTSDSAPIPAATYDDEASGNISDDEDAQLADAENPFDVRHFTGRAQQNSDEDDDDRKDHEDEDSDVEMDDADVHATITEQEQEQEQETALTPGASASTPIPASSATPTPALAPLPVKRRAKPVDVFMKQTRKPKAPAANKRSPMPRPSAASISDDRKEASMSPQFALPSPMHTDHKPSASSRRVEESSESDVDSSDEDSDDERGNNSRRPLVNKNLQPVPMSREPSYTGSILSNRADDVLELPDPKSDEKGDEDLEDELDLFAAMEKEFDVSDEDEDEGGGGDVMIIEGEAESGGIGLGINNVNTGAIPMSLSRMTGGGRRDESEEESSEEE
ncbi:hypothetical protein ABW19_dt0208209 [Dactylella cylindrospora]|nr:hypothetical protein ABW19_dt0208209 [Dactylella cylindrospora]